MNRTSIRYYPTHPQGNCRSRPASQLKTGRGSNPWPLAVARRAILSSRTRISLQRPNLLKKTGGLVIFVHFGGFKSRVDNLSAWSKSRQSNQPLITTYPPQSREAEPSREQVRRWAPRIHLPISNLQVLIMP